MDLAAFQRDGALRIAGLFDEVRLAELSDLAVEGPGARLQRPDLPGRLAPATDAACRLLGRRTQPVRAVLFDKTPAANWSVAWHQDRTIPVVERIEVDGFGPWSRKDGILHVAPPVGVLERMVTLRIHIDPVGPANSPLKVALGSHLLGRVAAGKAAAAAAAQPELVCLAEPGDVWAYSTPILHASDRAAEPSRRRVLQVDYACDPLPAGLAWAGVT